MRQSPNYDAYAKKMRRLIEASTDLSVDARFIDMLSPRNARILDVGCGVGSAVNALRHRGHEAYGIDPTAAVLDVANDLYDSTWFRCISLEDLSADHLGKPGSFDVVLMAGNVPAFITAAGLLDAFAAIAGLLKPGGSFVIGTTAGARGGPADQDALAAGSELSLLYRFGDWHLATYRADSPWSVSVFAKAGIRSPPSGPDGIFILT
ncbi:SAM-dependent methyltransferase [Arthrobacter pigmenti]|uniref:SAM-dependent methyltransferase n=1 Tax=Arthrobacter pigmenti TaxID=271432 RepID=A0A846RIQ7_9MICC|nr:class I SAM-dependent methyltransferase [Arthrobacter pigmenti]NJC21069.1 SAM-dependent methyltransferase [Arthrobacter pigmenti]